MHRSRLQVVLIDSPPEVADAQVGFWSAALGTVATETEMRSTFTDLVRWGDGVLLSHQRLDHGPARLHLDIETDDVPAEVQRLESLGAVRVGEHDGAVHLHDPAGLVFCVVPVQSDDFAEHATVWG